MVADIGCGGGEAVMTAAAAFPASTFHGYDISEICLRWGRPEFACTVGLLGLHLGLWPAARCC